MSSAAYDRLAGAAAILTPTNPLVAWRAALAGFVLSPAFYIWLGMVLRRD
jgi:hypothetical protein